jgi:hypothetical protein
MYLNPRYLSVLEEVLNEGQQSYLRKELQLSGWEFCRGSRQSLSSKVTANRLSTEKLGNWELTLQRTTAAVSKAARFAVSSSGRSSAAVIPSVPPEKPSI